MAIRRSKQLLDELLSGQTFSAGDLDTLSIGTPDEDQFLDYKSGKQDRDKLKKTVRKWVLGFANAEGGTLILGVTEPDRQNGQLVKPREVDGVLAIPANELHDWATRLLSEFAGRFSPPPTILTVVHPKGSVLLVATNRAPQLIPRVEDGRVLYAIRIGDSTVDAPDFLIADLLLGRRNHPILGVRDVRLEPTGLDAREIRPRCSVGLDNLGFVTAEEVEIGVVSWSFLDSPIEQNSHLLQYIDRTEEPGPWSDFPGRKDGRTWTIARSPCKTSSGMAPTIKPFDFVRTSAVFIGTFPRYGRATVTFALYVMPKGSMPQWYEVVLPYQVVEQALTGIATPDPLVNRKPKLRWKIE